MNTGTVSQPLSNRHKAAPFELTTKGLSCGEGIPGPIRLFGRKSPVDRIGAQSRVEPEGTRLSERTFAAGFLGAGNQESPNVQPLFKALHQSPDLGQGDFWRNF